MALASNNNFVFIDQCKSLQNLRVDLDSWFMHSWHAWDTTKLQNIQVAGDPDEADTLADSTLKLIKLPATHLKVFI